MEDFPFRLPNSAQIYRPTVATAITQPSVPSEKNMRAFLKWNHETPDPDRGEHK